MLKHSRIYVVFFIFFFSLAARSQVEFIVAPNSSEATYSSNPQSFVPHHGDLYFGATDFYGWGFWKSDGTEGGTRLVTRKVYPYKACEANGKMLIIGHEQYGNPAFGVWISDGTEEGTVPVAELSGNIEPQFTTIGTKVFFRVRKAEVELWVTEGTVETTHRVTGTDGNLTNPDFLATGGELLYFSGSHPDSGTEPWRSDGTEEGTFPLQDIHTASSNPYGFCKRNDSVYFIASNDEGAGLYVTDGTTGLTRRAVSLPEHLEALDHNENSLKEIHELGDTLYFALKDNRTNMNDIYRYVGGDTVSLCYSFLPNSMKYPAVFYKLNHALVAAVTYPNVRTPQELRLLKINGSGASVYDSIMMSSYNWNYWEHQESDTVIYFEYGGHLWRTNGTPGSTRQMNEFYLNPYTEVGQQSFCLSEDRIVFTCFNDTVGVEPWIQLLGGEQIQLVRDINLSRGNAQMEVVYGNREQLFFTASSEDAGQELWTTISDGASAVMTRDINPGIEGSKPRNFLWLGDELYFSASDSSAQYTGNVVNSSSRLWKSDGSADGTVMASELITGFNPGGGYGNFDGSELVELNGKIILGATEPNEDPALLDVELFEFDNQTGSHSMIKNVHSMVEPFNGYSCPFALRKAGSLVFFAASTEFEGTELWVTDGTGEGTHMVKDINDAGNGSSIGTYPRDHNMTSFGDRLLFTPSDPVYGRELWISDGTETGTVRLTEIEEMYSTEFYHLTVLDDRAIFWVDDVSSEIGRSMWVTDGTPEGTNLLRNVGDPSSWLNISEFPLGVLNGDLYFTGTDGTHGFELWKTDGTAEGTLMVKDLAEGSAHSVPEGFAILGEKFYFFALSGPEQTTLWNSDGTEEGTNPVEGWDVTGMSDFGNLVHSGDHLYFTAHSIEQGQAMYRFYTGTLHVRAEELNQISVFPNPAQNIIRIGSADPDINIRGIRVLDISGKIILQRNWSAGPEQRHLDVSGLATGIYLVRVETPSKVYTTKLLKH